MMEIYRTLFSTVLGCVVEVMCEGVLMDYVLAVIHVCEGVLIALCECVLVVMCECVVVVMRESVLVVMCESVLVVMC